MSSFQLGLVIGIAVAGSVALLAFALRLLKPSGAWAAFALGSVVFGLGGLQWSVALITFFLLSSLLSKLSPQRGRKERERTEMIFEKGSTRDAGQVWANGGVAGIIVIIHHFHPDPSIFIAYLGALAAAAADTWGTEIGVMSGGRTISLLTLRRVEVGRSGGVSAMGSLGAVAGAASVAASAAWWSDDPLRTILPVVAGTAGMLADSLLGATLQAGYRCRRCGMRTERSIHCGDPAEPVTGFRWMNNDLVNLLCCATGGGIAWLLAACF
ncbi:MAG: rane protein [Chlorobi bacterium]|nr:rane protein [Chlorobiota bacterium]